MKINPTTLRWTAPTENTDGTPIEKPLDYELGKLQTDGTFLPRLVVIGTLQTDGTYAAPLSDMSFSFGEHTIALRAKYQDRPDLVSEWSTAVTFEVAPIPNPPTALAVEA